MCCSLVCIKITLYVTVRILNLISFKDHTCDNACVILKMSKWTVKLAVSVRYRQLGVMQAVVHIHSDSAI